MARGEGLRVRLSRIKGETPKGVLAAPLYLPAVIGQFGWTEESSHSEYTTIRDGQFSQPAMGPATARQLRGLDNIETLTVDWDPPWLVEQGQDPDDVYRSLYAVLRCRRPVELLATPKLGPSRPLLRMNVTVRSITAQLRQGEPDSLYFTVGIREWRRSAGARKAAGDALPTTHILKAGDTLHSLAMHYYHSATYATDIADANGIRDWGKSTPLVQHKRFKIGSKIKIPQVYSSVLTDVGPAQGASSVAAALARPRG